MSSRPGFPCVRVYRYFFSNDNSISVLPPGCRIVTRRPHYVSNYTTSHLPHRSSFFDNEIATYQNPFFGKMHLPQISSHSSNPPSVLSSLCLSRSILGPAPQVCLCVVRSWCAVVWGSSHGHLHPLRDLHPPFSDLLQPNRFRPFHALRSQTSASLGRLWLAGVSRPEDPFRSTRSPGLPESVADLDGLGTTAPITCRGGRSSEEWSRCTQGGVSALFGQ